MRQGSAGFLAISMITLTTFFLMGSREMSVPAWLAKFVTANMIFFLFLMVAATQNMVMKDYNMSHAEKKLRRRQTEIVETLGLSEDEYEKEVGRLASRKLAPEYVEDEEMLKAKADAEKKNPRV